MQTAPVSVLAPQLPRFQSVRARSTAICRHLATEDFVVQPMPDASPAKWHLGHTTWFFETFLLVPFQKDYPLFNPDFGYVFNSYYETLGHRVLRTDRGNLTRPTVEEVLAYRRHVDMHLAGLLSGTDELAAPQQAELEALMAIGLQHEEQHQELLVTDLKYTLGHNPLFPAVPLLPDDPPLYNSQADGGGPVTIEEGVYEIGFSGRGFCFDNELGRHKVYLHAAALQPGLVTNAEYMAFMEAGGYGDFNHWLAEGWDWVRTHRIEAPLYWHRMEGVWHHYTPGGGLQPVPPHEPVCHVSFYEADAYARWRGLRLPTEFEWEVAAGRFAWGRRWEWTQSAYLPYPGFRKAEGAVGEYNGKFMVNQMVLRGASVATPPGHSRRTYRNFFHADKRWQFTGIRLAESL